MLFISKIPARYPHNNTFRFNTLTARLFTLKTNQPKLFGKCKILKKDLFSCHPVPETWISQGVWILFYFFMWSQLSDRFLLVYLVGWLVFAALDPAELCRMVILLLVTTLGHLNCSPPNWIVLMCSALSFALYLLNLYWVEFFSHLKTTHLVSQKTFFLNII